MSERKFKPYVPDNANVKELSMRALVLGVFMAIILGSANAYLGLRAGMTVAATFPAAVIAMGVLRLFKGTILEENMARTTGAVGEALAAGAIFTIPAFVLSGVWEDFSYLEATGLLLVGGVLGVLFVIIVRRTLVTDVTLPFPEAVATGELVKAGQGGAQGSGLVFGSMGVAALLELFKNGNGVPLIGEKIRGFFTIGDTVKVPWQTPAASPAFVAVGYIIGPTVAARTFAGGVLGWLFLMPLISYLSGGLPGGMVLTATDVGGFFDQAGKAYNSTVKMMAVGGMIVGAFYTLFRMRNSLIGGIKRAFKGGGGSAGEAEGEVRIQRDLNFKGVLAAIGVILIPMFGLYFYYTGNAAVALVTLVVMVMAGLLFAAVAGFLVANIGSSSNPISGLTLTTLLMAAGLLALMGMTGAPGVKAALAVATIICCVAGVAGDMVQDWKAGFILGGTPWRMQIGGLVGVVASALVLILPIMLLHKGGGGIGSENLPAPQAGLMANIAQGVIGGTLPWGLILAGMAFAFGLILMGVPSPMLIAVGMYLPFSTTFAIFVGGVIAWFVAQAVKKRVADPDVKAAESKFEKGLDLTTQEKTWVVNVRKFRTTIENRGTLIASGLVAGEALIGVLLAGIVVSNNKLFCTAEDVAKNQINCISQVPDWFGIGLLGLAVLIGLGLFIVGVSLKGQSFNKNEAVQPGELDTL